VWHKPWTNFPSLQISFQNFPGLFLTDSKAFSLVFVRLSRITVAWVFSIFSLIRVETGWPRWGSSSSNSLPSRKCTNYCAWFRQSSLYTFLRSCYVTIPWNSAQFKVKFYHNVLLFIRTFDPCNKHAYFDGNKMTATDVIEKSLCLLRWAHYRGQDHFLFC